MDPKEPTTTARRPVKREIELDFVRGIAILMVVDFHSPLAPLFRPFTMLGWPHFGGNGVGVFFVLSGFLVGGLLMKEWKTRNHVDSKRFLIRRGFKIWPQYYFYIALILITGHRAWATTWGNVLNIQNYVGGVAHTWTLAVEEHAYLLLTLLLYFAARKSLKPRTLFYLLAAVAVSVSFLRFLLSSLGYNIFTATHTRIDGIVIGVMLALGYHFAPARFERVRRWRFFWWSALVLTILFYRIHITNRYIADLDIDAANVLGVSLIMLLAHHEVGRQRSALYRLIAWIGLYSYGIYLWHVSLIAPIVKVGARMAHTTPHWVVLLWLSIAPLVLAIALGVVMTKLIEFPALRLRDRLFPRRVDSAVGIPAEFEPTTIELTHEPIPISAPGSQPIA